MRGDYICVNLSHDLFIFKGLSVYTQIESICTNYIFSSHLHIRFNRYGVIERYDCHDNANFYSHKLSLLYLKGLSSKIKIARQELKVVSHFK